MPTEDKVICPHCGRKTDPGNFCQRCTKPLDAQVAESVRDAANSDSGVDAPSAIDATRARLQHAPQTNEACASIAQEQEPAADLRPRMAAPIATAAPPHAFEQTSPRQPSVRPVTPVAPVACAASASSSPLNGRAQQECALDIEYNFARAFVVGQMYPFQFRIRSRQDDIERLVLCFRGDFHGNTPPPDQEVTADLGPGWEVPWSVSFAPSRDTAGEMSLRIYVGYQTRSNPTAWKWFFAVVDHLVYSPNEPVSEVARSINVNIVNNIENQGHAVDIHTRSALDHIADLAEGQDTDQKRRELVAHIAGKKVFALLKLNSTKSPVPPLQFAPVALPPPPPEARLDRLTLERHGRALHLCGKMVVAYGRKRENNDLVLRCYQPNGIVDEEPSRQISKYHGEICFGEDGAWVSDDPFNHDEHERRPAALGTALDGRRIPPRGKSALHPGQNVRLEIASGCPHGAPLTLTGTVAACPQTTHCPAGHACRAGLASGVLLRRTDHVSEDYALVWRCLPLDAIFPDLAGARVYRNHDAFLLHVPGCAPCWLHPGAAIAAPQGAIHVSLFRQKYL